MMRPNPFLTVRYTHVTDNEEDIALCAGFELLAWRREQFAQHMMEWLPEFALRHDELVAMGSHNAVALIRKAARTVYATEKYANRGEFGELLLHIAIRQVYETEPAISKIYYKSSVNKTVEGFDAVHVVVKANELELWIGETKFYSSAKQAIDSVSSEIVDHMERDYLRNEFILISNKIDSSWPHADRLRQLLDANTSLDDVFARACIPVLITYDSESVQAANKVCPNYEENVSAEVNAFALQLRKAVASKRESRGAGPLPVRVHAIFVPLHNKKDFVESIHRNLRSLK
jgi:hypothetical protein